MAADTKFNSVNWDAIEPMFKAGVMSVKAIAKLFNCSDTAIHTHAKKNNWTRAKPAKDEMSIAKAKAANANPAPNGENPYPSVIEQKRKRSNSGETDEVQARARARAADVERLQGVVITDQIERIIAMTAYCERLLAEGEAQTAHIDVILEEIEAVTANDRTEGRARMLERAVSYASRVQSAKTLASAMAELVKIERQAYKISDDDQGGGEKAATLEERIQYYEKQEAIEASGGRVVPITG